MLELLVGMVILGVLGAIGYGTYTNFIRDARDTALDQNIPTAAAEIQSVLSLDPTLAPSAIAAGTPGADLVTAMTNRTNFVWDTDWVFPTAASRESDVVHSSSSRTAQRLSKQPPALQRPSPLGS